MIKFFTSFTGIICSLHFSATFEPSWVYHGEVPEAGSMGLSLKKVMYHAFLYTIDTRIIVLIQQYLKILEIQPFILYWKF